MTSLRSVRGGDIYEHIGSTGSVFAVSDRPILDPENVLECYPAETPGTYWIGGSFNGAGMAVEHALARLSTVREDGIDWHAALNCVSAWTKESPRRRPLYLPYVTGERCPIWNSDVRATWLGLSPEHTAAQMTLAIYEGVALLSGWILAELRRVGVAGHVAHSAGRVGENESFARMRATIYDLPVRRLDQPDAALFGAALIAAVVADEAKSTRAGLDRWAQMRWVARPDASCSAAYRDRLAEFRRWCPSGTPA